MPTAAGSSQGAAQQGSAAAWRAVEAAACRAAHVLVLIGRQEPVDLRWREVKSPVHSGLLRVARISLDDVEEGYDLQRGDEDGGVAGLERGTRRPRDRRGGDPLPLRRRDSESALAAARIPEPSRKVQSRSSSSLRRCCTARGPAVRRKSLQTSPLRAGAPAATECAYTCTADSRGAAAGQLLPPRCRERSLRTVGAELSDSRRLIYPLRL